MQASCSRRLVTRRIAVMDTMLLPALEAEDTTVCVLFRSTKSETRLRFRAQGMLLAASGTAMREISRRLRCTIGTASKWRMRAGDGLAGLSEVGVQGAAPKYGVAHQQRILAMYAAARWRPAVSLR